jgi:hypothetical protein
MNNSDTMNIQKPGKYDLNTISTALDKQGSKIGIIAATATLVVLASAMAISLTKKINNQAETFEKQIKMDSKFIELRAQGYAVVPNLRNSIRDEMDKCGQDKALKLQQIPFKGSTVIALRCEQNILTDKK